MFDLNPVSHVVGWMLMVFGGVMLVPAAVEIASSAEAPSAPAFLTSAFVTFGVGGLIALSTNTQQRAGLSIRQAFLMTVAVWFTLPLACALPFALALPALSLTDAIFESVSGITTTGSTVIIGLERLPIGINLWRGMLNWLGGLGIAFVAMIFLPVLRIGGMQVFRAEGFDTLGKVLPRASDIAGALVRVYVILTAACIAVYLLLGMTPLDAVVNGAATIATGGFSSADASFGKYPGAAEYAGALFMILGSLPYIRYAQMLRGNPGPLLQDVQVRAFLVWVLGSVAMVVVWRLAVTDEAFEPVLRETLFNMVSIFTGTGFFSGTFSTWGGFALIAAFVVGMIGGCSSSSSGALSVFRVQLMGAAILGQLRQIASPHRVPDVRYDGKRVDLATLDTLVVYVALYVLTIGVLSVALTLIGVDMTSAVFGVWTSIGNIGYGFGPMVAATGTFIEFPTAAKWILILAMLLGRLSLIAVFVVLMPRFWLR
ncbi:MAG: TrkH family potassium uptake protein [Gemmobacter sp.]|nr:TrkH family potassium uptake protein [Gemmobacter sp.]